MSEASDSRPKSLEPGEPFEVRYGNAKRLTVQALSFRSKRRVVQLLGKIRDSSATPDEKFDAMEAAFGLCCPDAEESTLDNLTEVDVVEVISKTISGASVSEGERKKSESPL